MRFVHHPRPIFVCLLHNMHLFIHSSLLSFFHSFTSILLFLTVPYRLSYTDLPTYLIHPVPSHHSVTFHSHNFQKKSKKRQGKVSEQSKAKQTSHLATQLNSTHIPAKRLNKTEKKKKTTCAKPPKPSSAAAVPTPAPGSPVPVPLLRAKTALRQQ